MPNNLAFSRNRLQGEHMTEPIKNIHFLNIWNVCSEGIDEPNLVLKFWVVNEYLVYEIVISWRVDSSVTEHLIQRPILYGIYLPLSNSIFQYVIVFPCIQVPIKVLYLGMILGELIPQ